MHDLIPSLEYEYSKDTLYVISEFHKANCEAMVVGSTFFGYSTYKSDIDILIGIPYLDDDLSQLSFKQLTDIQKYSIEFINNNLKHLNLQLCNRDSNVEHTIPHATSNDYSPYNILYELKYPGTSTTYHIIVYLKNAYEDIKQEHLIIYNYLKQTPKLRSFIKSMKSIYGNKILTGTQIYNLLFSEADQIL